MWDADGVRGKRKCASERAGKIFDERSSRYRALQKKDKKTARPSRTPRHFLGNSDS
jgi:hypothetical protein